MVKPWRVVSNADGVDEEFATLPEAIKAAEDVLDLWRQQSHDDGEWDEDVEFVEVHLVTHAARIVSRDGDNEEDGVEYGIAEILGNEIDEDLRRLRAELTALRAQLSIVEGERDEAREYWKTVYDNHANQIKILDSQIVRYRQSSNRHLAKLIKAKGEIEGLKQDYSGAIFSCHQQLARAEKAESERDTWQSAHDAIYAELREVKEERDKLADDITRLPDAAEIINEQERNEHLWLRLEADESELSDVKGELTEATRLQKKSEMLLESSERCRATLGEELIQVKGERDRYRELLVSLLRYAEMNTCCHESTYRGGTVWEICDSCEAKWADDDGGKPEWVDPAEIAEARAALHPATEPDRSKPPCLECGAATPEEAEKMCICAGDKDNCHGCELWPDYPLRRNRQ